MSSFTDARVARHTPAKDLRGMRMRRILGEDPDWSLRVVPSLSNLCLQSIMSNFKEKPVYDILTPAQRDFVQEQLSTSMPLHVTALLIGDGVYWKRCCEQRSELCDVSHYGYSWKRMFFERHLEKMIELFIPGVTEEKTVLNMVPLCENFVKRLDITQLLLPIKEIQEEEEEEDNSLQLSSYAEYDRPSLHHFDLNILLSKLKNLEELHLVYRVKQCGMNFEWKMFEMTTRDCESLGKAVQSCKTLRLLRLHRSQVDDIRCRLLVKYLLDHPSLRELDLSYNTIGNIGARAIGKLLRTSKLETLNMCDNNIRGPGAKAIAWALSGNATLLTLNLRLNRVGDEGGVAIGRALQHNSTLRHLHLGSNEVKGPTARALSQAMVQNNTLKSINLSCNKLGVIGGKNLEEAMSHNTSLTDCNIGLTEIDEQSVCLINQAVWRNQNSERRGRVLGRETK